MRVAVALLLFTAGVLAAESALAGSGDPQKRPTATDQAQARRIALSSADFPPGWKPRRSGADADSDPRCPYYKPDQSDLVETGEYDSSFTHPTGSSVVSSVGIYETAEMARKAFSRVVRPELARCFADLFRKSVRRPATIAIRSVGSLAFPRQGGATAAYRVLAVYRAGRTVLPLAIDFVVFNLGRVDVALGFIGVGAPFSAATERSLVAKVIARAHVRRAPRR
jgi:hypothetical protein